MSTISILLFWAAILIVVYAYGGYLLCIKLYKSIIGKGGKRVKLEPDGQLPTVSFIVAAYNESRLICEKIENTLQLQYASDKLEIIIVTDGSNDNTPDLVQEYYGDKVRILHQPKRMGKSAAINRAVASAQGEILVFSDANTILDSDALYLITRHFQTNDIGGVSGKKMVRAVTSAGAANEEGAYWKYESFLKQQDSDFHTVVGAAGELFSVRKKIFVPIPSEIILDDFFVSLKVCEQGYKVVYEQKAIAAEYPSMNIKEEAKRKIRIAAGGFQSIVVFRALLNIFKYGKLSFLYVSHRVLRWAICPFLLPLIFVLNVYLIADNSAGIFYWGLLFAQVVFYALAFVGWLNRSNAISFKLARIPYYFVFMNLSVVGGFWLFLRGGQSSSWQRSARAELAAT
ncbi:MAG TPA: glycosyltransferase family 2 protein [Phnomibacter sp.]|nr:glycosyltransferase family 2 protein [Phnomibacter sp.]